MTPTAMNGTFRPKALGGSDYLIRAFNSDVPFDQLVREQIAGDLLPAPRIATNEGRNDSLIGLLFFQLGKTATAIVRNSMAFIRR